MEISKNKVVTLLYELHENNAAGELIEVVEAEEPFVFLFGTGGLIAEFEAHLEGKTEGTRFEFSIPTANAYGDFDEEALEYVPKDIFVINGALAEDLLEPDKIINLRDNEGQLVRARVAEVSEEEVLLDFNHPLAGVNLYFKGEILDVRNATLEELSHGHVHGPGGHKH